MSTAANHPVVFVSDPASATTGIQSHSAAVPWYIWTGVLAVTCSYIGGVWDVSWHRSIGRDTFWTPAHMAIYACGVLAGFVCTWLIVSCTLSRDPQLRESSVSVLGLRAPLGVHGQRLKYCKSASECSCTKRGSPKVGVLGIQGNLCTVTVQQVWKSWHSLQCRHSQSQ